MENRKKPANPVPKKSPAKAKPDDFEPDVKSQGPQTLDPPTSPPHAYDCGNTPPAVPRK